MEFRGDYHTHSTYSDGRQTVREIAAAAARRGLSEIGLADHGPANIGAGVKSGQTLLQVKKELQELQAEYPGMKLLAGVEANIVSIGGLLDVEKSLLAQLDFLLVGLHPYVIPRGSGGLGWIIGNRIAAGAARYRTRVKNTNTKALIGAIHRYKVEAVTHPGLKMEIDIAEAARACQVRNTAWEINSGHRHPDLAGVLQAAACGVDFVVNSDAHFPETVGQLEYGARLLEKAKVPAERIRNIKYDNAGMRNASAEE